MFRWLSTYIVFMGVVFWNRARNEREKVSERDSRKGEIKWLFVFVLGLRLFSSDSGRFGFNLRLVWVFLGTNSWLYLTRFLIDQSKVGLGFWDVIFISSIAEDSSKHNRMFCFGLFQFLILFFNSLFCAIFFDLIRGFCEIFTRQVSMSFLHWSKKLLIYP